MNREEIIEMLASVKVTRWDLRPTTWDGYLDVFHKFADLVAAREREECAKVADKFAESSQYKTQRNLAEWCASSIRARGQL